MQFLLKHHMVLLISSAFLFFLFENLFPLRTMKRPRMFRWKVNILLSLFTYATVFLAVRPSGLYGALLSESYQFGFLKWFKFTPALEFVFSILLLDLTFYYWHRLNHLVPFFWRFHNTHHYDPDMDVTTAFRFHFVEIFYSGAFRFLQILILGVNPVPLLLYDFLFQLEVYFHHSNLRLPFKVERYFQGVFVSPRFHSVHHTAVQSDTHSNFSVIFSFWDRLHGTARPIEKDPGSIGVPGYQERSDNFLTKVLTSPFKAQKDYWHNYGRLP